MTVAWVAVGAAVVGGAASYLGAKKQADASTKAAGMAQGQAAVNRGDQMPFIQSGYGALGKLNTLMGINADPNSVHKPHTMQPAGQVQTVYGVNGTAPNMGIPPPINDPGMMTPAQMGKQPMSTNANPQLRQLLSIRADNGDAQARQLLGMIQ